MREFTASALAMDAPVLSPVNWPSFVLVAVAAVAAFRFKLGFNPLLAGCAAVASGTTSRGGFRTAG